MKKIFTLILFLLPIVLISCNSINKVQSSNITSPNKEDFKYKGTWKVDEYYYLDENEDIIDIKGELIILSNDSIQMFNYVTNNVKYKLKVVDENYVISYEYNIRAAEFMEEKESLDIISVIDNNKLLCEFFMNDNDELIVLTKRLLMKLVRVSENVDITMNSVSNFQEGQEQTENLDVGVMLGLKKPRELNEDGTYTNEEYRTIWVSYENEELNTVYEKQNIIFPRLDGIWKLSGVEKNINGFHYDGFEVSNIEGRVLNSTIDEVNTNVYKSIKFVGNDYISIEKYQGDNFQNNYPIYQIIPINNVNIDQGLSIDEIFNVDAKARYLEDFKLSSAKLTVEEIETLNTEVNYSNISMDRKDGKWILKGKISPKNNYGNGKDFDLSLKPNNKLINFNSLLIPWKNLRGEIPFIKDAFTAPNNSIAIIQFKDYISVYKIEDNDVKAYPLINISLESGEEIIMAEWCEYGYIDNWESVFLDGKVLEE